MKKLLCLPLIVMFLSGLAFGQIPVCTSPTQVGCTDYFGVANWANSPLPAGTITGYTIQAAGSGYVNPVVVVTDPTGLTFTFTLPTTDILNGSIISTAGWTVGGAGYTMPQISIVDGGAIPPATPSCGGAGQPACGSGALATAVIGPPFTGGMMKFQAADTLANRYAVATTSPATLAGGLTLAAADTTTFSQTVVTNPDGTLTTGSDYYEIALVQYTQKLHSSLPATTLRGYVQVPTGSTGCSAALAAIAANQVHYLGPSIVAAKNRPVRVKFTNCLPTGTGGNLFIPTDTTYMGAGSSPTAGVNYTQNRATLHLHGGATPWISDGTPHQWTVPVGETSPLQQGVSAQNVPDMYFVNGVVVPQCNGGTITTNCSGGTAAQLPAGATNNPGQGSLTFYWTNQQGGRLMFFHDHAYGLTRLNVYAGEAAGYLLYDPAEEAALLAANAPGTLATDATQTAPDLNHLIPLVIQDKTFVPSLAQINATDPTWVGHFGTPAGLGDLWFPHVYVPNQNPADPTKANGFGHWDYGAWFFPPQTTLTAANPTTAVTVPCTSSAFPGQTLAPSTACPTCGCPITPNPSGTPESFMDTPLVNGVAYPVLHVAPAAYRFKILAAGNDRSWNLSWFIADPTQNNTEVAMVPANVPSTTNPSVWPGTTTPITLCSAIQPVAVPALTIGLATGFLDASGNPLNGTGLYTSTAAPCWPNYGPVAGAPPGYTMWPGDGRAGGVPDPRRAGPPWIQIGSEGGLLPAPVVIPATPVNYEQNTRSITITSVGVHGLWLGPAERADVIVDFSQALANCTALGVSPCTLILYNDAPAPAPAFDTRLDYFTNDGDQTPIGGAPNTPPGYGPNTRTIMQVIVDDTTNPNTKTFSLSALKGAFASTAATTGVFKATQPTIIVPEAGYNSAYNAVFPNTYGGISDNTMTFTPITPSPGANVPPLTFNLPPCAPYTSGGPLCATMDQKAIQELFTLDYGRMNATLGHENPLTTFQNQTTVPLGYVDWPTELIQQGQTQIWKVTHNGVDTHFIHFHLFNVQVINRVGWDGSNRQPDANELGWKDTVRMNPLEDIFVALQPITPTFPFPLPDSIRSIDVTKPNGVADPNISGLDPTSGNATITTVNNPINLGWEYVWHCHILGHEENDMMRPMIFQVAPPIPSNPSAAAGNKNVGLSWTDNSASETSFSLQRSTTSAFLPTDPGYASFTISSGGGFSTPQYGQTVAFTDATVGPGTVYFYRVRADDNFLPANPNPAMFVAAPLSSPWLLYASVTSWQNTTTTITPAQTPNPSVAGQPVTVNVSVASAVPLGTGVPGPSGSVTVTGNGSTCTVTLTQGTGTTPSTGSCQLLNLTSGTKTITAAYLGGAGFNSSTSAGVTQQVRDFSLTITPNAQTVKAGQNAKYTVTLQSLNAASILTGTVALTCAGTNYPTGWVCSVPTSVTLPNNGKAVTATLTVSTTKTPVGGPFTVTVKGVFGTGIPATGGLTHTASATTTSQ